MGEEMDIKSVVREVMEEYVRKLAEEKEPAVKAELAEERRRREQLERKLGELTEESERNRRAAEQAERFSTIRSELQRLGVKKPDLAFRLIKDDVFRGEDGDLYARAGGEVVALRHYLTRWAADNPEFLPARIAGGSGAGGGQRQETEGGPFDLSRIRPGMSAEEKERARREIARLAGKDFGGWL